MITLKQAAAFCGGAVLPQYEQIAFTGAAIDSRAVEPGQLFVALQGARDGHDFIPMAIEHGAAAALGERQLADVPMIVVPDARLALGAIARHWREQMSCRVVGITGSVGKTTTKEMTAAVLQSTFQTHKTKKNFNNDLGLPMTILDIPPACEAAVTEMGMNHLGEISYLTSIAQPDVAVITNIGTMHIENLGSREGILRAKLEILEGLRPGGQVILNGDEPLLRAAKLPVKPLFFGIDTECDLRAVQIELGQGFTRFIAEGFGQRIPIDLPVEGRHNVYDALAAALVGLSLGVRPERIAKALSFFRNTGDRQNVLEVGGYTLIADCYNAGPESVAAALAVLRARRTPGRRVAVLGDMLELGDHAPAAHTEMGRRAAEAADLVLLYGPMSHLAAEAAGEKALHFETHEDLVRCLRERTAPGDLILFKGSHGMHMERALELFTKEIETEEAP